MIVEFQAREWKWRMLFDLVGRIDSTSNAERQNGSGDLSEKTDLNITLVIDSHPGRSFSDWTHFYYMT